VGSRGEVCSQLAYGTSVRLQFAMTVIGQKRKFAELIEMSDEDW